MLSNSLAYSVAIKLLTRREYSAFELREKLLTKGFTSECIDYLISELRAKKLQCDNRFTESYINMRIRRGFGPIKIAAELKHRRIDPEIIKTLLSSHEHNWKFIARALCDKKFGRDGSNSFANLTKQNRFLMNKGFAREHLGKFAEYEEICENLDN